MKEDVKNNGLNELEELKQKCDEYLNKYKRAEADFINYKKGEAERAAMIIQYAKESYIMNLLPVLDSIYLADEHIPEHLKDETWFEGFGHIKKQIEDFLAKEGIEQIKTQGQQFDPNTMEVVEEVDGQEAGVVVQELQKGYAMDKRVIRPARVKVTK